MLTVLIFLVPPAILAFLMRKTGMLHSFYRMISCLTAFYIAAAGAAGTGALLAKAVPETAAEWAPGAGALLIALMLFLLLVWSFHFIKEPESDQWQTRLASVLFNFFAWMFFTAFLLGLWCSTPANGVCPLPDSLKTGSESVLNGGFRLLDTFSFQPDSNRKARKAALKKWMNPVKTEEKIIQEERASRTFPQWEQQPAAARAYADDRKGNYTAVTEQVLPPLDPALFAGRRAKRDQNDRRKDQNDPERNAQ